jgi:hypothetical protein
MMEDKKLRLVRHENDLARAILQSSTPASHSRHLLQVDLFHALDQDRSGYVEAAELHAAFRRHGIGATPEEVGELLFVLDEVRLLARFSRLVWAAFVTVQSDGVCFRMEITRSR